MSKNESINLHKEEQHNANLLKLNKELIEKARMQGHDRKNGQKLSDLELLAELQHYKVAVCLIDFTENPLLALWFACQQSTGEKTGRWPSDCRAQR